MKSYLTVISQQVADEQYEDDGWDQDIKQQTTYILDKIYDLKYEIENGVRGSMSGMHTKEQLKQYLIFLGNQLAECAEFI